MKFRLKNKIAPKKEADFPYNKSKHHNSGFPIFKISKKQIVLISLFILASPLIFPFYISAQNIEFRDDLGHKLTLKSCPQRIISLAPNLTEILFALGLNQEIIGVTRYCDYPQEARTKEKIGGLVDLNQEKIQSLHPDLILGFRGNPRRTMEKLYKDKLPVLGFESGQSFEDLFQLIAKIGRLTCRPEQAAQLIAKLKASLTEAENKLSAIKTSKKVFLTLYGRGSGLWTCGRRSYLNHLLGRARLENVASSLEADWLVYNREKLIEDNPELILILCQDQAAFDKACLWFESQPAFQKITAVHSKNFRFLEENRFSRFSPRLIEAYQLLLKAVYPE
ncbi:MAG: ABC transporter substrate-binding protein, partial [Candidatus Saccharicenans sp.]